MVPPFCCKVFIQMWHGTLPKKALKWDINGGRGESISGGSERGTGATPGQSVELRLPLVPPTHQHFTAGHGKLGSGRALQ